MEKAKDAVDTWGPVREAERIRRESELKHIKRKDAEDYSKELSFDRKQARAREAAGQEASVERWRSQEMESWNAMQQAQTLKREQDREAKEQTEQAVKDTSHRTTPLHLMARPVMSHVSDLSDSSAVWKAARGLGTKEVGGGR